VALTPGRSGRNKEAPRHIHQEKETVWSVDRLFVILCCLPHCFVFFLLFFFVFCIGTTGSNIHHLNVWENLNTKVLLLPSLADFLFCFLDLTPAAAQVFPFPLGQIVSLLLLFFAMVATGKFLFLFSFLFSFHSG